MAKTFAQYLIDNMLPGDMHITKQIDKKYLEKLLIELARKYPDRYGDVVMDLKRLADRLSTYEGITMGIDEIEVPHKEKRDAVIRKYTELTDKDQAKGDHHGLMLHLKGLQDELSAINKDSDLKDDATLMINSALGDKATQLMKLRVSPGIVADHDNRPVPIIFPKSYAEGVDPTHFWLNAADSRRNIAHGQVKTADPGELGKVWNNILAGAVVSIEDCGTKAGIMLDTKDDSVIGRYLARDAGSLKRGQLIEADQQQALLRDGIARILVRSPQTCTAHGGTVCQMCMGLRNATGKLYNIGDNAGLLAGGSILEPMQQMALSAKHSAIKVDTDEHPELKGEPGFRQLVMAPKNYRNRKVLCEVIGTVFRIRTAPQGGRLITIHQTKPVPDRYVVNAMKTPNMKMHWDYYVPPTLKVAEGITEGVEVWPGMELSTGVDNLQDISRLRNLGFARSAAAENMYSIYRRDGHKLDRRHFELLARQAHPYVKVIRCPRNQYFSQGEVVTYEKLCAAVAHMPSREMPLMQATGHVLAAPASDITIGTELDAQMIRHLKDDDVSSVKVVEGLEVAAEFTAMDRVVDKREDWLSAMNHRRLKEQMITAASTGKVTDIHGYNPHSAYAYGVEFGMGQNGKY